MPIYQRMTPTEFGEWIRDNLTEGKCVDFALDENGGTVSDEEMLTKGEADLEKWWFAAVVEFPEYGAKTLLINYAGGGTPYAIEVDEYMEEILEAYFHNINDDFDDEHQIVVEVEKSGSVIVEVSIEDGDGRIIEYEVRGSSIEAAKKEARRRIEETCLWKHCKTGEITVSFSICENNGEYIDSDEASANWDGKRVRFYEEL